MYDTLLNIVYLFIEDLGSVGWFVILFALYHFRSRLGGLLPLLSFGIFRFKRKESKDIVGEMMGGQVSEYLKKASKQFDKNLDHIKETQDMPKLLQEIGKMQKAIDSQNKDIKTIIKHIQKNKSRK